MPYKKGLEYFRQSVNKNASIKAIMRDNGGIKAFGVITALCQEIAKNEGYYFELTSDAVSEFSYENIAARSYVLEIINLCVNKSIFDKEKYEKYNILTNESIQQDFYDACKRRKQSKINLDYIMPNFVDEFKKLAENAHITNSNVNITKANVNITKQRRGEQEDKEKENNINVIERDTALSQNKKYYEFFKKDYPAKTDAPLESTNNINMQLLYECYTKCVWLHDKPNLTLKWLLKPENYKKLIENHFAQFQTITLKSSANNFTSRKYTKEEFDSVISDIDEVKF